MRSRPCQIIPWAVISADAGSSWKSTNHKLLVHCMLTPSLSPAGNATTCIPLGPHNEEAFALDSGMCGRYRSNNLFHGILMAGKPLASGNLGGLIKLPQPRKDSNTSVESALRRDEEPRISCSSAWRSGSGAVKSHEPRVE